MPLAKLRGELLKIFSYCKRMENSGAFSRNSSRRPHNRRHRGKAVLQARRIAEVSDQLSAIIEAEDLSLSPIAGIQLGKTFRRDGQHTKKPMSVPAGIAK